MVPFFSLSPRFLGCRVFTSLGLLLLGGCCTRPPRPAPPTALIQSPRAPTAEKLRVVRQCIGPLKRTEFDTPYLEVPGRDGPVQLYLREEERSRLGAEDPSQPLEIRYWYREETLFSGSVFGRGELASIRNAQAVILDRAICHRHNETMVRRPVPIEYGLPLREFMDTANRDFPHAAFQLGGCCVDTNSPQETPAYVCASCDRTYQAWSSPPPANAPTASP